MPLKSENVDFGTHDPDLTVPVSVRLPLKTAYLITLYAERMNTSTGKLLHGILEDVLPAFTSPQAKIRLRLPEVYRAMEKSDLLTNVPVEEVRDRVARANKNTPRHAD